LIHCVDNGSTADITLPFMLDYNWVSVFFEFSMIFIKASINFRPGLVQFLEKASKIFEIIIFTASQKSYADVILNHIEKGNKYFHHRLYRQNCIFHEDRVYIKDLRILGRDLKNVIIVDNAPYSFASQIDNGYPIIPFYDNKSDNELQSLMNYLITIEKSKDIREDNRLKFKLKDVTDTNICDYAQYYQHTGSDCVSSEQSCESLSSIGDETPNMYEKVKRTLQLMQVQLDILYKPAKK